MDDLSAQCAQDTAPMIQLLETNQLMSNNMNAIMQELQSIRHKMNYSISHATSVLDRHGSPSSIYAEPCIQQTTPPPPQTQYPLIPFFLPHHMPTGTQSTMQHNPPYQWMLLPPGFH